MSNEEKLIASWVEYRRDVNNNKGLSEWAFDKGVDFVLDAIKTWNRDNMGAKIPIRFSKYLEEVKEQKNEY